MACWWLRSARLHLQGREVAHLYFSESAQGYRLLSPDVSTFCSASSSHAAQDGGFLSVANSRSLDMPLRVRSMIEWMVVAM